MRKKSVGIRELKAHLSSYLSEVKAGGELIVSERGVPVAKIVPVLTGTDRDAVESMLLDLAKEGKIIIPAISAGRGRPSGRKKVAGSPFSDAVIEERR